MMRVCLSLVLAVSACGADPREAAEDAVRASLRDPEAAQFRNLRVVEVVDGEAVCGEVNGKNGFGAYVGYRGFIVWPDGGIQMQQDYAAAAPPQVPRDLSTLSTQQLEYYRDRYEEAQAEISAMLNEDAAMNEACGFRTPAL